MNPSHWSGLTCESHLIRPLILLYRRRFCEIKKWIGYLWSNPWQSQHHRHRDAISGQRDEAQTYDAWWTTAPLHGLRDDGRGREEKATEQHVGMDRLTDRERDCTLFPHRWKWWILQAKSASQEEDQYFHYVSVNSCLGIPRTMTVGMSAAEQNRTRNSRNAAEQFFGLISTAMYVSIS